MEAIHVEDHFGPLVDAQLGAGIHAGHKLLLGEDPFSVAGAEIEDYFMAHQLRYRDLSPHRGRLDPWGLVLGIVDVFRADAEDDRLADVLPIGLCLVGRDGHAEGAGIDPEGALLLPQLGLEEIHGGAADEAGHKQVGRAGVEGVGGIHLLQAAIFHDGDAVAHGHGFHLVVGDVDEGGAQLHVQLADLGPRLHPQLGVEVGEGLIHQKHRRVAHNGPPDGHPLPLPTGKFLGLAVEKVLDPKALGHPPNPAFDLRPWQAAQLEAKGHVLGHGHVGVEGIGLEDHGDIPILGGGYR